MSKLYPKKAAAVTRRRNKAPYPDCYPVSDCRISTHTLALEVESTTQRQVNKSALLASHNAVVDLMWGFKILARDQREANQRKAPREAVEPFIPRLYRPPDAHWKFCFSFTDSVVGIRSYCQSVEVIEEMYKRCGQPDRLRWDKSLKP